MSEPITAEQAQEINGQLEARAKEGYLVNNAASLEIAKLGQQERNDLIRWLASEDGAGDRRALHDVSHSEKRSQAELTRVLRNFRSRQPFETRVPAVSPTDAYLRERKQDIKSGLRRR